MKAKPQGGGGGGRAAVTAPWVQQAVLERWLDWEGGMNIHCVVKGYCKLEGAGLCNLHNLAKKLIGCIREGDLIARLHMLQSMVYTVSSWSLPVAIWLPLT